MTLPSLSSIIFQLIYLIYALALINFLYNFFDIKLFQIRYKLSVKEESYFTFKTALDDGSYEWFRLENIMFYGYCLYPISVVLLW